MDLSTFLTINTPSGSAPKSGAGHTGLSNSENDAFTAFFENFLDNYQLPEGVTLPDRITTNAQLEQAITTLESLLIEQKPSGDIIHLENFAIADTHQITINSHNIDELALSDQTKLALLSTLLGTPIEAGKSFKDTSITQVQTEAPSSPFANTEATLNGDELFEKILDNLRQNKAIILPTEAVIASGVSPQELEALTNDIIVSLRETTNKEQVPEDLLSLLGLVTTQTAVITSSIIPQIQRGNPQTLGTEVSKDTRNNLTTPPWYKELSNLFTEDTASESPLEFKMPRQQAAEVSSSAQQNGVDKGTAHTTSGTQLPAALVNSVNGVTNTEWVDPITQEWLKSSALPSAMNGTNLTSIVTQAPHAHSAHPATHMLAVSMQKNINGQDTRNWTLRLDPPDLGKVEVELNFSKDKLVKAQIIVEKPETWMMLQRDAQVLERALQEAGIDIDSNTLGFELASDGSDLFGDGSKNGANQNNGSADDSDTEIIETTMTWFVDPNSGMQRYNLVV